MQVLIFDNDVKWHIFIILVLLSSYNHAIAEEESSSTLVPTTTPVAENNGMNYDPTMAIVLVSLLSAFFMICVITAYFRHYTEQQLRLAASTTHGSETGSMRSVVHGLDPAVLATFASFSYSSVKGIKLGQTVLECAVCLNEFQDHETLRLLPMCSHVFHRECIDTWLAAHVTCPVCRADLVLRPGELSELTESLHCPLEREIDFASTEFLLPVEAKHDIHPTTEMPRSHSTGHLVRPVENTERYTLRLPNEALALFMNMVTSLPTSPHPAFPMESSEKMTFRSISVGSTRRLDYSHYAKSNSRRLEGETSRAASTSESHANNGNDFTRTSNSHRFFRSVRSPFDRFFRRSNRNFDAGERLRDQVASDVEV
uniref:RING-H2 finger protein ATL38-like n=1 Tax=Erigeron canadensis TaxID=72917 RepID=UPI001CB93DF8|nr:RING-H2 finger protein ATL38-like [Erigeron canadensis]